MTERRVTPGRGGGWTLLRNKSEGIRRSLQGLLKDAEALAADSGDAITASRVIAAEIAKWEESAPGILRGARDLLTSIEPDRLLLVEGFEQQLTRELSGAGHRVYGESSLLIVDGIVHVDIDLSKFRILVNDTETVDLSVSSVATRVREECDRLRKALTPPKAMLEMMLLAYQREIRATEKAPSAQVETTAILLQLAMLRQPGGFRSNPRSRNFREYPRELFRADLFTLLSSNDGEAGGTRLRYASGSDTVGAIFMMVPALGRAAHVGRIWFAPAEAELV